MNSFEKKKILYDVSDQDYYNNGNTNYLDDDEYYDEYESRELNDREIYYNFLKTIHSSLLKYIEEKSLPLGEYLTINKLENFINKFNSY